MKPTYSESSDERRFDNIESRLLVLEKRLAERDHQDRLREVVERLKNAHNGDESDKAFQDMMMLVKERL